MAQNPLPPKLGALVVLAGKCAAGLTKYAAILSITDVTATGLTTEAATLTGTMNVFNAQRTARTTAHIPLNAASAAAKKYISDARAILATSFGDTFNAQWLAAGWINDSTAVPAGQPERLTLLLALKAFLTANPAYAATTPTITFTAAQAQTVHDALDGALEGVATADANAGTAKDARTAAELPLRADLRLLIGLLNRKLTPNDPRWVEFGLKAPGAAVTPHAPEHLENHPALAKQLHATCGAVPGADYYRWFLLLPGGTGPVFQQDTADPEVLLENLTSGQTVQLTATAVNPAGESVPSQPLAVVVG